MDIKKYVNEDLSSYVPFQDFFMLLYSSEHFKLSYYNY